MSSSVQPTNRFIAIVQIYVICFAVMAIGLDLYSLFVLSKHRHMFDTMSQQILHHRGLWPLLIFAAIVVGMLFGVVMGLLDALAVSVRSLWVRWLWFVPRMTLLFLIVAYHWISGILLDTIQNHLAHLPFSPQILTSHQTQIVYGWTLYGSFEIIYDYYSPLHLSVWFIAVLAIFFVPRISEQIVSGVWGHKRTTWILLSVWTLAFIAVLFPSIWVGQVGVRPACNSTSISLWWLPGCRLSFVPATKPKANDITVPYLKGYHQFLRNRSDSPTQKIFSDLSNLLSGAKATQASGDVRTPTSKPVTTDQGTLPPSTATTKANTPETKPTPRHARPHIIVFFMEAVTPYRMGLYGYTDRPTTPFLDSIAPRCLRFTWAFSNSNSSKYGITSFFSSRGKESPEQQRVAHTHPIFSEGLQQAGYRAGLFSAGYRFEPGLENYVRVSAWDRYVDSYNPKTHTFSAKGKCVLDCHLVAEVKHWIEQAHVNAPLMAVITLYSTHFPYKQTPRNWQPLFIRHLMPFYSPIYLPPSMIEIVREYYDDALRYVDTQQEEIVSHLQQLGILDQSILLFISDHGEDLYLRSGPAHGVNLYNTQIRIPFVLCGPGVSPGVRTDNVSLLDVGPTLLHLAGLPSHPSFEGQNVLAPPPHFPRPIFVYNDFIRRSTAVISGSYKFIRSYSRHTEELYNTRRDPLERNDLSQKQPDIAHVLRWILEQEEMRR